MLILTEILVHIGKAQCYETLLKVLNIEISIFSCSFIISQEYDLKRTLILVNLAFFVLTLRLNFLISKIPSNSGKLLFFKGFIATHQKNAYLPCLMKWKQDINMLSEREKLCYPEAPVINFSFQSLCSFRNVELRFIYSTVFMQYWLCIRYWPPKDKIYSFCLERSYNLVKSRQKLSKFNTEQHKLPLRATCPRPCGRMKGNNEAKPRIQHVRGCETWFGNMRQKEGRLEVF